MNPVNITNEKMSEWFPKTYKYFIDELRNSKSKFRKKSIKNIEWMIAWSVSETSGSQLQKRIDWINKLNLTYFERCKLEAKNLCVYVTMKAGFYIRTDIAFDKELPEYIVDSFCENMAACMIQEQLIVNNPIVLDSLEEFKYLLDEMSEYLRSGDGINYMKTLETEIESLKQLRPQETDDRLNLDEILNLDDILDKISFNGMQSLNTRELEFLEKTSKKEK